MLSGLDEESPEQSPEKPLLPSKLKIKPYTKYILLWNHKSIDSSKIKFILTQIAEQGLDNEETFVNYVLVIKKVCESHFYTKTEGLNSFRKFVSSLKSEEHTKLFKEIIPFIAMLALRVELMYPEGILPLLSMGKQNIVKLSRGEVACILANQFFCALPKQSKEFKLGEHDMYTLMSDAGLSFGGTAIEKLRCIFGYFEVMMKKEPDGIITIARNCLSEEEKKQYTIEGWLKSEKEMLEMKLETEGRIENQHDMIQVDFANKFIGGGIDGFSYQEQVLFAISPELYSTCLICEEMNDDEAILITGVQVFSNYSGYDLTFKYAGSAKDPLEDKKDILNRIPRQILGLDALPFGKGLSKLLQFEIKATVRELNKALIGFKGDFQSDETDLRPIATGKWGCGVFNGCLEYKWLIQWIAASEVGRKMIFCGFDGGELVSFYSLIKKLEGRKVGEVVKILIEISELILEKREKLLKEEGEIEDINISEIITQFIQNKLLNPPAS